MKFFQRRIMIVLLGLAIGSTWGWLEAGKEGREASILFEKKTLELPW